MAKTLASQCRGPGLIPDWGTRSHMPQLRPRTAKDISKCFLKNGFYTTPQSVMCAITLHQKKKNQHACHNFKTLYC